MPPDMHEAFENAETFTPRPGVPFGSLRVLSVRDALEQEINRDYLVKGLVNPGEMSVWYGAPGSGKSFAMLHLGYAIAQGRQALGRRVRYAPVLYVACEATSGIARRIRALANEHGVADDFLYIPQSVDLSDPDSLNVPEIIDAAKAIEAKLVVVDTLARAMQGGDENSSQSMGLIIEALDRIKEATGAHVATVHHSGKNEAAGMRGHSSLLGAADVVVEITGKDGPRVATIAKNKEDSSGDAMGFKLRVVELGTDSDEEAITSCVVDEIEGPVNAPKAKKLTDLQEGWLRDIRDLFLSLDATTIRTIPEVGMQPLECVTREQIRTHLTRKGRFIVSEGVPLSATDRTSLKRNLEALRDKGKLGISGEYVWLI